MYGVCEATFLTHTEEVIERLVNKREHFIKFPLKRDYEQIAQEFNDCTELDFPGVIGCVDG